MGHCVTKQQAIQTHIIQRFFATTTLILSFSEQEANRRNYRWIDTMVQCVKKTHTWSESTTPRPQHTMTSRLFVYTSILFLVSEVMWAENVEGVGRRRKQQCALFASARACLRARVCVHYIPCKAIKHTFCVFVVCASVLPFTTTDAPSWPLIAQSIISGIKSSNYF